MSFVPQQNWTAFDEFVEPVQIEKDRSMSASEKLRQYAEIFDSVWYLKSSAEPRPLIDPATDEKFILRKKMILAFRNVPGPDRG